MVTSMENSERANELLGELNDPFEKSRQLRQRIAELRRKLEEKLAKAPPNVSSFQSRPHVRSPFGGGSA